MQIITILMIIVGHGIYASESSSAAEVEISVVDKAKQVKRYSSFGRRKNRMEKKVNANLAGLRAQNRDDERSFADDPQGLIYYRRENALVDNTLPLESPEETYQIHRLKKIHKYTSGAQIVVRQNVPLDEPHDDSVKAQAPTSNCASCCCVIL